MSWTFSTSWARWCSSAFVAWRRRTWQTCALLCRLQLVVNISVLPPVTIWQFHAVHWRDMDHTASPLPALQSGTRCHWLFATWALHSLVSAADLKLNCTSKHMMDTQHLAIGLYKRGKHKLIHSFIHINNTVHCTDKLLNVFHHQLITKFSLFFQFLASCSRLSWLLVSFEWTLNIY